jgi:hypothetical protein
MHTDQVNRSIAQAHTLLESGNRVRARAILQPITEQNNYPEIAKRLLAQCHTDPAIKHAILTSIQNPADPETILLIAQSLWFLNQRDNAISLIRESTNEKHKQQLTIWLLLLRKTTQARTIIELEDKNHAFWMMASLLCSGQESRSNKHLLDELLRIIANCPYPLAHFTLGTLHRITEELETRRQSELDAIRLKGVWQDTDPMIKQLAQHVIMKNDASAIRSARAEREIITEQITGMSRYDPKICLLAERGELEIYAKWKLKNAHWTERFTQYLKEHDGTLYYLTTDSTNITIRGKLKEKHVIRYLGRFATTFQHHIELLSQWLPENSETMAKDKILTWLLSQNQTPDYSSTPPPI